ncbi:hypothetical protein MYX78_09940 [Acidobacteria bacterium AH-259-G07]|nr:hypothetical protein [Acidobacteria bacterium AH-259-G07]
MTPYIGAGKPPILLIYADGDEDWRKQHNEGLKDKLFAAGYTAVRAVEIPNRNHSTVWKSINQPDDQTARHMLAFMGKH